VGAHTPPAYDGSSNEQHMYRIWTRSVRFGGIIRQYRRRHSVPHDPTADATRQVLHCPDHTNLEWLGHPRVARANEWLNRTYWFTATARAPPAWRRSFDHRRAIEGRAEPVGEVARPPSRPVTDSLSGSASRTRETDDGRLRHPSGEGHTVRGPSSARLGGAVAVGVPRSGRGG
jgi:hypothetical protein